MLQETDQPLLADRIEEASEVRVKNIVHLCAVDSGDECIQRIVLAALGPEPVREAEEVFLVDRVQHRACRLTRRTALLANHPLGSAEITHPFHPRRGQRFVVLKVRRVSGVETLSLRHVELGSFAVPREWTDWAPLDAQAAPTGGQLLLIDAFGLSTLTELVTLLTRNGGLDR